MAGFVSSVVVRNNTQSRMNNDRSWSDKPRNSVFSWRSMSQSRPQSVALDVTTESEANRKYTAEELEEYGQVFSLFDKDGSGAIGTEELGEAMLSLGMNSTKLELQQLINEIDADGNGEIDFEEFCDCMKKMSTKKQTDEDVIRECFTVFDQDANGVVTEAEFKHVMRDLGQFPDAFIDEFFQEVDVAGNGHIEYDEFSMMVRNYLLDEQPAAAEDQ